MLSFSLLTALGEVEQPSICNPEFFQWHVTGLGKVCPWHLLSEQKKFQKRESLSTTMPGLIASGTAGKRKRGPSETRPKKRAKSESEDEDQFSEAQLARLERDIVEKKKYDKISSLIRLVQDKSEEIAIAAAFAACKIFAKLMAAGELSNKPGESEESLRKQYSAYKRQLLVRCFIFACIFGHFEVIVLERNNS